MANFTFIYKNNSDTDTYDSYEGISYPQEKYVNTTVVFDDATRWDNVMLEFAKFLDACGYVGVNEKVYQRILDEWEFITKDTDEDSGNT